MKTGTKNNRLNHASRYPARQPEPGTQMSVEYEPSHNVQICEDFPLCKLDSIVLYSDAPQEVSLSPAPLVAR